MTLDNLCIIRDCFSSLLSLSSSDLSLLSCLDCGVVSSELVSGSAPPRAGPHLSPSLAITHLFSFSSPLSPTSLSLSFFLLYCPPENLTSPSSHSLTPSGPEASLYVCVCHCVCKKREREKETHLGSFRQPPHNDSNDPAAALHFDIIALTFTCHYHNLST